MQHAGAERCFCHLIKAVQRELAPRHRVVCAVRRSNFVLLPVLRANKPTLHCRALQNERDPFPHVAHRDSAFELSCAPLARRPAITRLFRAEFANNSLQNKGACVSSNVYSSTYGRRATKSEHIRACTWRIAKCFNVACNATRCSCIYAFSCTSSVSVEYRSNSALLAANLNQVVLVLLSRCRRALRIEPHKFAARGAQAGFLMLYDLIMNNLS